MLAPFPPWDLAIAGLTNKSAWAVALGRIPYIKQVGAREGKLMVGYSHALVGSCVLMLMSVFVCCLHMCPPTAATL